MLRLEDNATVTLAGRDLVIRLRRRAAGPGFPGLHGYAGPDIKAQGDAAALRAFIFHGDQFGHSALFRGHKGRGGEANALDQRVADNPMGKPRVGDFSRGRRERCEDFIVHKNLARDEVSGAEGDFRSAAAGEGRKEDRGDGGHGLGGLETPEFVVGQRRIEIVAEVVHQTVTREIRGGGNGRQRAFPAGGCRSRRGAP